MKNVGVNTTVNHTRLYAAFILLTVSLAIGASDNQGNVIAQGSDRWAISQAQRAVRQQIVNQVSRPGGQVNGQVNGQQWRNLTVRFNTDAQTDSVSNTGVRVRGTGSISRNDNSRNNNSRNDNSRNNYGRTRDFNYEAIVNTRNRNRNNNNNVSGIRYEWSDGWSGNGGGQGNGNDAIYNNANRPNGRVSYSGSIINRHSNKGLDVTEQSMQEGANIQQWGYSDQPNQNWDVIDLGNGEVAIISRQSGMAITVQGGNDNNGANIIQRSWNGNRQQRWRLEQISGGYYQIVSVDNGKCLDVTERGRQDGANVQLWNYANQANQHWRLNR